MGSLTHGEITLPEFTESLEALPNIKEFQDKALDVLSQKGVAQIHGDIVVVDKIRTQTEAATIVKDSLSKKQKQTFVTGQGGSAILHTIFSGKRVVTKEQWKQFEDENVPPEQREEAANSLLYSPESVADAFTPEKIREQQFLIAPWEVSSKGRLTGDYPSTTLSDPQNPEKLLPKLDVSVACAIYHPSYGNGYRDENGILYATDPRDNQPKPISSEILLKLLEYSAQESTGLLGSPTKFLQEGGAPFLTEYGLLKPEDFRTASPEKTRNPFLRISRKEHAKGMIEIDRNRYALGKKFGGRNYSVCLLTSETAGILETDSNGEYTLILVIRYPRKTIRSNYYHISIRCSYSRCISRYSRTF